MHIALEPAVSLEITARCHGTPARCRRTAARPLVGDRDRQFVFMLAAFRPHGGLLRAGEISRRASATLCAEATMRLVWNDECWWPWFQFDRDGQALNVDAAAVAAELAPDYDAWELAVWFAEPNAWLAAQRPVDRLRVDPGSVRAAARADRFVRHG